ncbi:hypothetical protein [Haloferula sp. A504]|uniref:hypothetical protein n=1 Tax=Haloferula sp. A504 TaxID=3373601 RepID=UPI0031C48ACF|nr:hypothetical protein [Verrucomicrobiaceae bacterium E54]
MPKVTFLNVQRPNSTLCSAAFMRPCFMVALSGHRPVGAKPWRTSERLDAVRGQLERELSKLEEEVEAVGGELHLVCSVAAGADLVACEIARDREMPMHLILPKPEEEFLAEDFGGDAAAWRDRAVSILDHVKSGVRPSEAGERHCTLRVVDAPSREPDCYEAVNFLLLDVADVLLTVNFLGGAEETGGTAHVTRQAAALGLPHVNVDPADGSTGLLSEAAFQVSKVEGFPVFERLGDHLGYDGGTEAEGIEDFAERLDQAANHSSKRFRTFTKRAICSHAAAGFIAALAASCYHVFKVDLAEVSYWLLALFALVELLLVGYGFFLEFKVGRDHVEGVWLDCRFAREVIRGLESAAPFLDPLFLKIHRHLPDWGRFATSCALEMNARREPLRTDDPVAIAQARDQYIEGRIQDQIGYFTREKKRAAGPGKAFVKLAHLASPAALLAVGVAFVAKAGIAIDHGHTWSAVFKGDWSNALLFLFLPVFFPLLASLSFAFMAHFDFGRRSLGYGVMVETLEHMERRLRTQETLPTIRRTVSWTEERLLAENIEWLATQKSGLGH